MQDEYVDQDVKMAFQLLVKQGRIEIVNGGLSANDEACSYYEGIIE